jgi:hypothetical protein
MTPLPGGFDVDYRFLPAVKALLAFSALALLAWDWRFCAQASPRVVRMRNVALATIGVLSLAAWWNFGALHGSGRPLHLHDFFHYYIGSKYFPELGYTRIYQCTAVAEVQQGRSRELAQRWTRNLNTNALEQRVPARPEIDECLSTFGAQRWGEFTADVEWFRSHMRPAAWIGVPMVFGHNATPVWNAVGFWLTGASPASDRQMLALAVIDPILLAIIWLMLWRTFGWQAGCVAAIWWGLNEATGYYWVGGGFLRQDALFCIVSGVCALRTGRNLLAGVALGTAALLRAFPVFLLLALSVKVLSVVRTKGLQAAWTTYRSFAVGGALAGVVLLTLSTVTWSGRWEGSLEPWKGFASNSRKHLDTPITNHVGLKPALWFSSETRAARLADFWVDGPWDSWRRARTETVESRKPLYVAIVLLFLVVFWSSVRRLDDWIVLVAGIALLPFVTTLANYYYSVLLLFGLLWPRDKAIGLALVTLSALTTVLPVLLDQRDDRYVIISAAVVVFAFFVMARLRLMSRQSAPAAEARAAAPSTAPA